MASSSPKKKYICNICNKEFKSKQAFINHTKKQICIPKHNRTYCHICDKSFSTIQEFKFHNISVEHLDKLNLIEPDKVTINNQLYNADPYLDKSDINKINNSIIGDNLTIIYNNNKIEKLSTETFNNINNSKLDDNKIDTISKYEDANKHMNYQDIINQEILHKPKPTERQIKIFKFLSIHQSSNLNFTIGKFKLILSKINLDDANFFATHLRESNIIELRYKQLYGKYLDLFINTLISKYNKGEDLYNDMNIMNFVTKLTK